MYRHKHFRNIVLAFLTVAVFLVPTIPVLAASKTKKTDDKAQPSDISASLTQTYYADSSVQVGMIVELKPKDTKTVIPLVSANLAHLLGVVIPADGAPIVLTAEKSTGQQVLVATSGRNSVLVSNQGGPIKPGDYVTISSLSGVGMKAGESQAQVVGKAAGSFSGTANVIGSVKLKNQGGHDTTVSVGRIPVDLYITHNPLFQKSADFVPGFLAKAAVTVANKPVSVARIYLSAALLAITAFIAANMLYSGIKSGMIAVGRNPLSKKSIIKSLIQTVIAGVIVFVLGVFAVYLLLKL